MLPVSEAKIGIDDLGLTRSYAVFDYMRTYNGKPFALSDHLDRLRNSGKTLHLELKYSDEEIAGFVDQLLSNSNFEEAGIRFLLTGGNRIHDMTFDSPNFIIVLEKLPTYPEEYYTNGVKLITYKYQREVAASKTTDYLNALRLSPLQKEHNAFDILYHNKGCVLELTRNNIFIVNKGEIITPKENILKGITRKHVIALANKNFTCIEREVMLEELWSADEVFITGTSKKVIPVRVVDQRSYLPSPGPITTQIMKCFDQMVGGI